MARQNDFVLGMVLGAGLMYLLDPERGRRRRSLLRDQMAHGTHTLQDLGDAVGDRARDLRNRARGMVAETRGRMRHEEVDDPVLEARVRTELGRLVSNPGSIEVMVQDGRVTLSGLVPDAEATRLLTGVRSVRGVDEVIDRLEVRAHTESVPGLQGTPGQ